MRIALVLGLGVFVAACDNSVTTTGGSAASGGETATGGNASTGGNTATGGNASTGGAGGSSSCSAGEERCVGDVHQVCENGMYSDAPCAMGTGCDPTSGACAPCVCTPGETEAACVDANTESVCETNCLGFVDAACAPTDVCVNGSCGLPVCMPGTFTCESATQSAVCNADGTGFDPGPTCAAKETCTEGVGCESLCSAFSKNPSSVGCSFFALNMDNYSEANADGVIVGNTSSSLTAIVNFYTSYNGVEAVAQSNIQIPPLTQTLITLPNGASDYIHGVSALRVGGAFRIESDIPVVAYQHSPIVPQYTNDASLLLPEPTLGQHYFVPSYYDALGSYPSYFDVVGTVDGTTVTITMSNTNAAGTGVPATSGGSSFTVTLDRYDTLQVVNAAGGSTATRDLMGTEIVADNPVSVFGGVECAQVPAGYTYCDHIEEQALPTRTWGMTYVGAHIPKRSNTERYYWRVMAQEDGTTIDTTPSQSGFPVVLNKGQFYEFYGQAAANVEAGSFVMTGDKPFSAFQYISGQDAFGAGTGDPAMITAVPVEQFLNRYVILTPSGYSSNYVQVVRTTADDVLLDGVPIASNAYYTLGVYTVADVSVSEGPHVITSNSPFGLVGAGYTSATSYGYPGGLALNNIAPN